MASIITSHELTKVISRPETSGDNSTQSAVPQVFDTIELLEWILSHLPLKDVLRAQRVSTTWQETIARSPLIQKGLFMTPATRPSQYSFLCVGSYVPTLTTREYKRLHRKKPIHNRCKCISPRYVSFNYFQAGKMLQNPLLKRVFRMWKDGNCEAYTVERNHLRHNQRQESWEKMFLTQPPTTHLQLSWLPRCLKTLEEGLTSADMLEWDPYAYRKGEAKRIEKSSGITLGDLVKEVGNVWLSHENANKDDDAADEDYEESDEDEEDSEDSNGDEEDDGDSDEDEEDDEKQDAFYLALIARYRIDGQKKTGAAAE